MHASVHACFVDGEPCERVPVDDRGLQYGDGLFETMLFCGDRLRLRDRHLERLCSDATRLRLALSQSVAEQEFNRVESFLKESGAESAVVKVIITRGSSSRGYRPQSSALRTVVTVSEYRPYEATARNEGVPVRVCEHRLSCNRATAGIKHLNRLDQVLARAEWSDEFAEGIMLTDDGRVIEGTMSNLFVVEGSQILTPKISDCGIDGVMRSFILDNCRRWFGSSVVEVDLDLCRILAADALFLCNSVAGVLPVRMLQEREYGHHHISRTIQEYVQDALFN